MFSDPAPSGRKIPQVHMFTSRNIHFAVLGIVLGASSGYVLAFYQVRKSMPPPAISSVSSPAQEHSEVSNEQLLAMFKEALERNPNDATLMTRYGGFLFQIGRYNEAVSWFEKVLELQPSNDDVRIAMLHGRILVALANSDYPAAGKFLKEMEKVDPKYAGLDSLRKRLAAESEGAK